MSHLEKLVVLLDLIKKMREKGSWCGETHIQKAVFFVQAALHINTGFKFLLYKHSPFSFDLRNKLIGMQADNLIMLVPQDYPYGPGFQLTNKGKSFLQDKHEVTRTYDEKITRIATELGAKGVAELERFGTALFLNNESDDIDSRAREITKIKPHIPFDKAKVAVNGVDTILRQFAE